MSITKRLDQDFVQAMKARHEVELSVLRMLRSALKNRQIELMHELSDEEALAVVRSQLKQLKDGLASFEAGKREDLAAQARAEIAVLERYLPAQLPPAEVEKVVRQALAEAGISAKAAMGKAMGVAMKAVAGQADGTAVKAAVEAILS
ncbi:GatB/YqeY domain-containing protein [Candidatus Uhrbacteria bacterium]|nr:GatB/YqeY domain-containing protein [Candidatus Uhrbacteria bacterium]